MFFVHQDDDLSHEKILKIYKSADFHSFRKEQIILELFKEKGLCKSGFPMVHSIKQNNKQAEILMEAIGPNLKKLKYQCPTKNFSKATALAIGIQLLERLE